MNFAIFFSIFFAIYGTVNFYIFKRGWDLFSCKSCWRYTYLAIFLIVSCAFLAGRFLERLSLGWFNCALVRIGSFWVAAMVYFFFVLLLIDIFRIFNYFFSFFPSAITNNVEIAKKSTASIVIILVISIVIAGYLNSLFPQIQTLKLKVPKTAGNIKNINIAVATDIHIGTIVNEKRVKIIVDKINSLSPDIVLLVGDIMDEDVGPAMEENIGFHLRQIQSKFGIFAVTGNHEYISGIDAACSYLTKHGIVLLRDETIKIADSFYLVGREDRSYNRFTNKQRKSLSDLLKNVDKSFPVILMDHQPYQLNEAEENSVDLQLSGHTHHGQLWPFNFITNQVYELSWGYKQKGNTHYYVSSGAATWGPPVRTSSRPEIINIQISFE